MPGDPQADDVVQETNTKVWEKRRDFENGTHFKAWILSIARFHVRKCRYSQQITQDSIADEYAVDAVRIGVASIGKWNEPTRQDPHFALRNLNGAMDEFTIFNIHP